MALVAATIAVVQGAAVVLLEAVALGGTASGGGTGGSVTQRRQIDPSGLEKLHADISLPQLRTWRNRCGDFCQLNQLATYPVVEQMAAFII